MRLRVDSIRLEVAEQRTATVRVCCVCSVCVCDILTGLEHFGAAVATRRELLVVAVNAVDGVVLRGEVLVGQRDLARFAHEARLVPVTIAVAQVLNTTTQAYVTRN